MGFVLSKFHKKETTEAVLEAMQSKIQALEVHLTSMEERKRRWVTNFVGLATGLYIVGLGLGYFFYYPSTMLDVMEDVVPLLLFPILIVQLRRLLMWYFEVKLNQDGDKLAKLNANKRMLLEQVMSQKTYKVAVDLLERFDDEKKATNPKAASAAAAAIGEPQEQKQSVGAVQPVGDVEQVDVVQREGAVPPVVAVQPVRRRTPFPIVDDRSRGAMARFLDFIVGDGPQNRYGMICKECHAHNGMLPEGEYEYASFWCVACNVLNEARKVRPVAPALQQDSPDISENFD